MKKILETLNTINLILFSPPHGNRFSDDREANLDMPSMDILKEKKIALNTYSGNKGNIGRLKHGD